MKALSTPRGPALLALALLALSLASLPAVCLLGPYPAPPAEVLGALAHGLGLGPAPADPRWSVVVWDLRLTRAVLAFLVGAGLAVAGAVFQGVLRNPLADAFTLGASGGAAFGAALAISLGLSTPLALSAFSALSAPTLCALAGSLAALAAVMAVARAARASGQGGRETLVLAGIVVATFLSAAIALVKAVNEESTASIVFWIMGSFSGRGRAELALFAPYLLLGLLVALAQARECDILRLGETQARQLGVDTDRVRLRLLLSAGAMSGAAVAVCGVVGFVGLVAPHMVRLAVGGAHRGLFLAAAPLGGLLLLWSDTLARVALPGGAELPVGVVTALLGGPFFLALLRRGPRSGRP